jgi:DNA-binding transcriptional ArsR family regulator
MLAVVAEPRRREILRLVWDRERSAGDIASRMDVTFGAVSQHLARLRAAGCVQVRRDGRQRFYRADRDALGPIATMLEAFWGERLQRLAKLAESEERRRRR